MKHSGRVHKKTLKHVHAFQIELEFGSGGFLRKGENQSDWRKTSRSKGENQQQTETIYGVYCVFSLTLFQSEVIDFQAVSLFCRCGHRNPIISQT